MNTQKQISLGLALVVLCAGQAFAIPLAFDLTGSVASRSLYDASTGVWTVDPATAGQAFSAQLVIDTDAFAFSTSADNFTFRDLLLSTGIPAISPWSSSLTIGGAPVNVAPYDLNYAYVEVSDSKGPISCGPGCTTGTNDSVMLVARSDLGSALGVTNSSLFQMLAYEPLDSSGATPSTYTDLDQPFQLASLLTMALPNFSFSYQTSAFDCVQLNICYLQSVDVTRFDVTSLTRTDLSAVPVPEPGVLGLLVAGLFGCALTRRRNTART